MWPAATPHVVRAALLTASVTACEVGQALHVLRASQTDMDNLRRQRAGADSDLRQAQAEKATAERALDDVRATLERERADVASLEAEAQHQEAEMARLKQEAQEAQDSAKRAEQEQHRAQGGPPSSAEQAYTQLQRQLQDAQALLSRAREDLNSVLQEKARVQPPSSAAPPVP